MQLSATDKKLILEFNRNIDWLKRNSSVLKSEPVVELRNIDDAWLSVKEAAKFVNRSRTWLYRITFTEQPSAPTLFALVKGVDWKRETNRVLYKRSSLENLKRSMEKAGDAYDERRSVSIVG